MIIGRIGVNNSKNVRRVTFASPNQIEKKQKTNAEDDSCVVSPDLFELSECHSAGNLAACSKVQSDLGCYSQKLEEPMVESIETCIENPANAENQLIRRVNATPANAFDSSAPFSSCVINISEVIAALISQDSKCDEDEQQEDLDSMLPDVDEKNLSVDELIEANAKCHENIDHLIAEIQDSS